MTRCDLKLTMSSSSQVSSSDTQFGSSHKLKPTLTPYNANELQEVVSCTKETVRITPPPQDAVALRPTILTFENNYTNGIVRTNYSKYACSPRVADKECQTDSMSGAGDNIGLENATGDDDCKNVPEENVTTDQFISAEKQEENKTRELDHINVIVTEYPSSAIQSEVQTSGTKIDEIENCDTVDSRVVFNINRDKPSPKLDEQFKEDKEEDSCCVKCFLVTLQVCDCCVIL